MTLSMNLLRDQDEKKVFRKMVEIRDEAILNKDKLIN
jgi:hypothetical protein